jgi:UDP-N-acetylmuramyl pentapeptide synthase
MPAPELLSRRWRRAIAGTLAIWAVLAWRRFLVRTVYVAVTGSVGKTTAKERLAAVVARLGPTVKTEGSPNRLPAVARTISRVRPWHRFAVVESDVARPGGLAPCARLVRPHVALLLSVARAQAAADFLRRELNPAFWAPESGRRSRSKACSSP